jgi:A/G-specific adenine glycosylase
VAAGTDGGLPELVLDWFAIHRRDLPWRAPGVTAWAVLVSEVMLQQTPVERVRPVWERWLSRWPTPADLAAEPPGEAVRAWDRLGYPRRALRLHAAAVVCRDDFGNAVPTGLEQLRALPGVGEYTAAAVAAFAHGQRSLVLDTNVRRVLARVVAGTAQAPSALTSAERTRALALLPTDPAVAVVWSVALMELGALVCTARAPSCDRCPVRAHCAWFARGRPGDTGPRRAVQSWTGSDRQARGRLLAVLRERAGSVPAADLEQVWAPAAQRERALSGLVADGLVEPVAAGRYALPGTANRRGGADGAGIL